MFILNKINNFNCKLRTNKGKSYNSYLWFAEWSNYNYKGKNIDIYNSLYFKKKFSPLLVIDRQRSNQIISKFKINEIFSKFLDILSFTYLTPSSVILRQLIKSNIFIIINITFQSQELVKWYPLSLLRIYQSFTWCHHLWFGSSW